MDKHLDDICSNLELKVSKLEQMSSKCLSMTVFVVQTCQSLFFKNVELAGPEDSLGVASNLEVVVLARHLVPHGKLFVHFI